MLQPAKCGVQLIRVFCSFTSGFGSGILHTLSIVETGTAVKINKTVFWIAIVLIGAILLTYTFVRITGGKPRHWFTKLESVMIPKEAIDKALPFDWDGDGDDELLVLNRWQGIRVFDPTLKTHFQSNWDSTIFHVQLIDIDGDTTRDIVISTQRDSIQIILGVSAGELSSLRGSELVSLPFNLTRCDAMSTVLRLEVTEDINGDGVSDYLCSLTSFQHCKEPRYVLLFDGATRKVLWEFCLGPGPQHFQVLDLDSDGLKEILFVGQAYGNKRCCSGYCDSTSYLIALDSRGSLKFDPVYLGGSLTYADFRLLPINNTHSYEIVVASRAHASDSCQYPLMTLDGRTGRMIQSVTQFGGYESLELIDSQESGQPLILARKDDGVVQLFDRQLTLLNENVYPAQKIRAIAAPLDFDADGAIDIPLMTETGGLLVLDNRLDSLFFFQGTIPLLDIHKVNERNNSRGLFVVGTGIQMFGLLSVQRVGKSFAEIVPPAIQITVFVLALGVVTYQVISRRRRRQYESFLNSIFEDPSRMIVGINSSGVVFRANTAAGEFLHLDQYDGTNDYRRVLESKGLGELITLTEKLRTTEIEDYQSEIRVTLNRSVRDYWAQGKRILSGELDGGFDTIVTIQDVTDRKQFDKYETLTNFSEQMIHDIRKPLSPVLLRLQELDFQLRDRVIAPDDIRARFVRPALDQIQLLSSYVTRLWDTFGGRKSQPELLDVKAILEFVVKARASLTEPGKKISLSIAEELPRVLGRFEDLCRIISELVDNALYALQPASQGAVEVKASAIGGRHPAVQIEVADDGPGIEDSIRARIFEMNVSTKESSHHGLGLFIVRKLVIEHGGSITVESTEGVGTRFVVILPGGKEDGNLE